MKRHRKSLMRWTLCGFLIGGIYSCGEETYLPKPKAYFRLDFPEKQYKLYERPNCPFSFDKPAYAIVKDYRDESQPCWFNLDFPQQRARIHFSYFQLNGDLAQHLEDTRTLVYKHTVKAINIDERLFQNPEKRIFSTYYGIEGNTASSIQFFITDSLNHFLRGALYFASAPNADSLAPSIEFISQDIQYLIEHFNWEGALTQDVAL